MMNNSFFSFGFTYAARSLLRNRRRSFITISTVIFSVAVTIIAGRFADAIMDLWRDGAADTGSAHAQIHATGYWKNAEGVSEELSMPENGQVELDLRDDPFVLATAHRLKIEGMISANNKSIYFIGIGVNPAEEQRVSPRLFNPASDIGTFVSSPNGITIGRGLADAMNLKVGDEASLISQTVKDSVNGIDVVIDGIVNVPLPSFSKRAVYLNIKDAQRLLRLPNKFNELAIRVRDREDLPQWVAKKTPSVLQNNAELRGWWDIEPIIRDVEDIFHSVIGTVSLLLFVSAALSVLNMIFMLVAERTVEIGTLMAIGAIGRDVRTLVAIEAGLIGLIGGVLGALLGTFVVLLMNLSGVPFKNPFSSGLIEVYPVNNFTFTAVIMFGALIICIIAAIPPARKASRVEPVQAFRGQLT